MEIFIEIHIVANIKRIVYLGLRNMLLTYCIIHNIVWGLYGTILVSKHLLYAKIPRTNLLRSPKHEISIAWSDYLRRVAAFIEDSERCQYPRLRANRLNA